MVDRSITRTFGFPPQPEKIAYEGDPKGDPFVGYFLPPLYPPNHYVIWGQPRLLFVFRAIFSYLLPNPKNSKPSL